MFVEISNVPRDYAWGSTTGIADALGTAPSGRPEAELWLGAHPGSPSLIVDPSRVGGADTLADWLVADPSLVLGSELAGDVRGTDPVSGLARLPFLLKVLAAGAPLSLQAHPSSSVALERFLDENEEGVPLTAADRNYKDPFHKPELIYALSDEFHALCGFRSLGRTRELVQWLRDELDTVRPGDRSAAATLDAFAARLEAEPEVALRRTVGWLLGGRDAEEVGALVELVVELAATAPASVSGGAEFALELETVGMLAAAYPGDPGVVLSLLLNRVVLARGEALFLPAGNIHAYLAGTGIELMASSDNVLRGGLTPKHIDVDELLSVLEFSPLPIPFLEGESVGDGVESFRPGVPEFALDVVVRHGETIRPATVAVPGPMIAIATDGEMSLVGANSAVTIGKGRSVFVTPDEQSLRISGSGTLFLATIGA